MRIDDSAAHAIRRTTLWVDFEDRITGVDDAWVAFARANGAPQLTRLAVVGKPIAAFMESVEVIELNLMLIDAARTSGETRLVPFRCDSPWVKRFMTMRLAPEPGRRVRIEYDLLRTERIPSGGGLWAAGPRADDFLYVCSWCKRVACDEGWREVDTALASSHLLTRPAPLPRISHGMCPPCGARVRSECDALVARASEDAGEALPALSRAS